MSVLYDLLNCRLASAFDPLPGHQITKTGLAQDAYFTYKSTMLAAFARPKKSIYS
jgi:hypothetical protein